MRWLLPAMLLSGAGCVGWPGTSARSLAEPQCAAEFVWNDAIAQRTVRRTQPRPAALRKRYIGALQIDPSWTDSTVLAQRWFERATPFAANELQGDTLMLCEVNVFEGRGLDPLLGDPRLGVHYAPDITVDASFAGAKVRTGVAPGRNRAVFAFRPKLETGGAINMFVYDSDVFSVGEAIGTAAGDFPGHFPFELSSQRFGVTCRALPPAVRERERRRATAAFDRGIAAFEAHEPTLNAIEPRGAAENLQQLASEFEFFGLASTEKDPRYERIRAASRQHQQRYLDRLDELQKSLPQPGSWVKLESAPFDARVAGLICQSGSLMSTCHIELHLRARTATTLCHADSGEDPALGHLVAFMNNGQQTTLSVFGFWRDARFVPTEADVKTIAQDDLVVAELNLDGFSPSPKWDEHDWEVRLMRVAGTVLRVY